MSQTAEFLGLSAEPGQSCLFASELVHAVIANDIAIVVIGGWGGQPTRKSVRLVHACRHMVWFELSMTCFFHFPFQLGGPTFSSSPIHLEN